MQYTVIIEQVPSSNYSAYVPDFPGCVATGGTMEEVTRNMKEAVDFHLQGMREDGLPAPIPTTAAVLIEVAA